MTVDGHPRCIMHANPRSTGGQAACALRAVPVGTGMAAGTNSSSPCVSAPTADADAEGDEHEASAPPLWCCAFCKHPHHVEQHFCDHCAKIRQQGAEPQLSRSAPSKNVPDAMAPATARMGADMAAGSTQSNERAVAAHAAPQPTPSRPLSRLQEARERDARLEMAAAHDASGSVDATPALAEARKLAASAQELAARKRAEATKTANARTAANDEARRTAEVAQKAAELAMHAAEAAQAAETAAKDAEGEAAKAKAAFTSLLEVHGQDERVVSAAPTTAIADGPNNLGIVLAAAAAPDAAAQKTPIERIQMLSEMLEAGLISADEFKAKKMAILDAL